LPAGRWVFPKRDASFRKQKSVQSVQSLSRKSLDTDFTDYWSLLEYASDKDYRRFDFGRSTPGKGAYGFKKQWGAEPYPLYWYIYGLSRDKTLASGNESMAMSRAVALWQRLPFFLANLIGPRIRGRPQASTYSTNLLTTYL